MRKLIPEKGDWLERWIGFWRQMDVHTRWQTTLVVKSPLRLKIELPESHLEKQFDKKFVSKAHFQLILSYLFPIKTQFLIGINSWHSVRRPGLEHVSNLDPLIWHWLPLQHLTMGSQSSSIWALAISISTSNYENLIQSWGNILILVCRYGTLPCCLG